LRISSSTDSTFFWRYHVFEISILSWFIKISRKSSEWVEGST
jgi:CRISPR/Cas system CMR-associated protein Cmr1 (group 7 of RAMP superfamily)